MKRSLVQMVKSLVFSDDITGATCESVDDDGSDYEPTVGFHFGFYSRPKDGARGVILKADGEGNTSFLFCWRDKQYEISLQKGEVGVQNAFGASTLWDKDGNIISTPGGSGKVKAGGASSTQPMVLGNTLETRLADLESKFLSHVHNVVFGSCTAGGTVGTQPTATTGSTLPHSGDNIKSGKAEVAP